MMGVSFNGDRKTWILKDKLILIVVCLIVALKFNFMNKNYFEKLTGEKTTISMIALLTATYYYQIISETALQPITTPVDQLTLYIETLPLHKTLLRNAFNSF